MHKNRDRKPKKRQPGRILARELSEELSQVQGGWNLSTFTQLPFPEGDFDRD